MARHGIIIIFQQDIQDFDSYKFAKKAKDHAGVADIMGNRQFLWFRSSSGAIN
jgi:hypothetical protein